MALLVARVEHEFGAGPFTVFADRDFAELGDDERMIVAFVDFEVLFVVIGRARGALHFGMFLTPWHYVHWRAERRKDRWTLATTDRAEIARLKRFYRLSQ